MPGQPPLQMGLDDASVVGLGAEHLKAIGYVVVAWSYIETLIDCQTWQFAGMDNEHGACLTSQISGSGRKLDALLSLIRHRIAPDPRFDRRLNKFVQTTVTLAERRNRIVHDPWFALASDGVVRRLEISARKRLRVEMDEHTTVAVLELAKAIANHAEEFRSLMADVDAMLRTSPETPL